MPANRTKFTVADVRVRHNRTLAALRESEARFETLAECAPVVIWMTNTDKACTYISRYWKEFTGRDPGDDLGFKWVEALHPDDRNRAASDLIDAAAAGEPCRGEYRVRRADGSYGWLYDYGVPYFHADGSYAGHIGTCMDITVHKHREDAEARLKSELILGVESERARVARELHDDISQRLAIICVALEAVTLPLSNALPDAADELTAVHEQLRSIAADIHRISHNLHPSTVELGLTVSLRRLCRDVSEQKHIAVEFVSDAVSRKVPRDVALALFRVAQECLNNVAKHSGGNQAVVSLRARDGELLLSVADQGVGFDRAGVQAGRGLGLVSIEERARMIGAHVEIKSAVSKGTVVNVHVPIHPHQHR
jgi:PAS domain S-box-containing protein